MNHLKSFLYSLSVHALLISLGLGAYGALTIPDEKKMEISLKILTYAQPDQPITNIPPEAGPPPVPLQISPHVVEKPLLRTPVPMSAPTTPLPATVLKPAPSAAPEPIPAIVTAPTAAKVPLSEPRIVPSSPPPALNAQARYEDENLEQIRAILAERLTYPKNALRLHQQGEVIISFSLTSDKEIHGISISKSSGFELLDDAARHLIETSASALPKPSQTVRITVPIGYTIR